MSKTLCTCVWERERGREFCCAAHDSLYHHIILILIPVAACANVLAYSSRHVEAEKVYKTKPATPVTQLGESSPKKNLAWREREVYIYIIKRQRERRGGVLGLEQNLTARHLDTNTKGATQSEQNQGGLSLTPGFPHLLLPTLYTIKAFSIFNTGVCRLFFFFLFDRLPFSTYKGRGKILAAFSRHGRSITLFSDHPLPPLLLFLTTLHYLSLSLSVIMSYAMLHSKWTNGCIFVYFIQMRLLLYNIIFSKFVLVKLCPESFNFSGSLILGTSMQKDISTLYPILTG